jgi:hypothetical protein
MGLYGVYYAKATEALAFYWKPYCQDANQVSRTHTLVREIEAGSLDDVFRIQQGHNWSPNPCRYRMWLGIRTGFSGNAGLPDGAGWGTCTNLSKTAWASLSPRNGENMNTLGHDLKVGEEVVLKEIDGRTGGKEVKSRIFICEGGKGMKLDILGGIICGRWKYTGEQGSIRTEDVDVEASKKLQGKNRMFDSRGSIIRRPRRRNGGLG